jgi:hypothetical protein
MGEPERSVEDVKRALLRDIDAGGVVEDHYQAWLICDDGSEANVNSGVWSLHVAGLCRLTGDTFELTDAGRAYLEAGTDG